MRLVLSSLVFWTNMVMALFLGKEDLFNSLCSIDGDLPWVSFLSIHLHE